MKSNKKLFSLAMALLIGTSFSVVASAAAPEEKPKPGFSLVDVESVGSIGTQASGSNESWGQGNLYASKPLFSNAQAYAVTTYNDGEAYKIGAKVSVKNKDDTTDSLEETLKSKAPSATSGTITSKSSTGTFYGAHRIQKTSSSGWQSCSTNWTP